MKAHLASPMQQTTPHSQQAGVPTINPIATLDGTVIEAKNVYLRQEYAGGPTVLVIGHGGGTCLIYRLTKGQHTRLAMDAPFMLLAGTITSP